MANISFQLNTTSGFSNEADAIANWGSGTVITAWVIDSGSGQVSANDIVYQDNDDLLTDPLNGNLSNPFAGGQDYYAFEQPNGSIAAAQIDDNGLVSSSVFTTTTTSTTATPTPTYSIIVTDGGGNTPSNNEFNEGATVNVTIQSGGVQGNTLNYTVSGTATENDFTATGWPLAPGATQGTLDFTNADTVPLQFLISNDLSSEGNETLIITLDAQDNNGNSAGQTETINILDTSVTNQPPIVTAGSATVTQNGTVTLDLSQNTSDPENDDYEIIVTSLPANGELFDNALPNTALTTTPYIVQVDPNGDNFKLIYKPGNSIGTTSFQWKAQDVNGNDSTVVSYDITASAPTNQAPVATNVNQIISNTLTVGQTVNFERAATDDGLGGGSLVFEWVDDQNGSNVINLAAVNSALNHGEITLVAGEVFEYETTTALTPLDSPVSDVFYFKVTDQGGSGLSDVGQVQIQLATPGNQAPSFSTTPPAFPIEITAGSANAQSVSATDPNGDAVSISVENQSGPIASVNLQGGVLTVVGTSAGTITVTLRATDTFGAFDANNDITFTYTVVETPSRGVKGNQSFSNSDTVACNLARTTPLYYYSTAPNGTTFLSNLSTGSFLYTTGSDAESGANPIIPTSAQNTWLSLEETIGNAVTIKAVKLSSTTGEIEEILNCNVTGGLAWPILVQYNSTFQGYCDGIYEVGEAWQNISETATLADVVAAGGQLFASEYYANQYSGATAPANYILADGAYGEVEETPEGSYYFWNNPSWLDTGGNYLFECAPDVVYTTQSLNVLWYSSDPTDVGSVCNAQYGQSWANAQSNFDAITIYYRAALDANGNPVIQDLLGLAKNQILPFATQDGANNLDYTKIQPDSVLVDPDTGGFVVFDSDDFTGYSGSARWYAFSPDDSDNSTLDNLLEVATDTSIFGSCGDGSLVQSSLADYTRPNLTGISPIVGTLSGARENVFYAFYACEPKLDPGVPGGAPYFPVYIVDGMHTATEGGSGISYILDFINEITNNNVTNRAQIKTSTQCLTYTGKIIATNIEEAMSFFDSEIDNLEQSQTTNVNDPVVLPSRSVAINAIDLGFGSQAALTYQSNVGESVGDLHICYVCETQAGAIGTWSSYVFPGLSNADILNRTIPNFDLETNYTLDNVSKPLLRTNPKLSTNAKLVANSYDKIYLESINATKELASVEYKKYELNPNGDWSQDLQKFYKNNYTPSDIIYATKSEYSDFAVQESFDKQIEEVYHYGTTYNYSKLHSEDFRMLAPIWLDKDIPKRFVVFRVNDPVGEMDFDNRGNYDNIQDLLRNSEIIKTFDLTTNSSLGKYLRKHINSESFPTTPIQFNFARGEKSSFRGIDLERGGFASKGEFLYKDFVRMDSPLISSNEMITNGFERNKLACANLINLEFLFDDNNATDYSINRYFGLYVNDIDSGYGSISSSDNGNVIFKSLISHINDDNYSAIPAFKQMSQTPTLGYLSVSDKYYKISSKAAYEPRNLNVIVEDTNNEIPNEIKLAPNGKSIDLVRNDSAGFDFTKIEVTSTPQTNDRFVIFESRESSYLIKFLRHIPNESWILTYTVDGATYQVQQILQSDLQSTFDAIQSIFNVADPTVVVDYDLDKKTIYFTEKWTTLGDLQISFNPVNSLTSSSLAQVKRIQSSVNLDNSTFFASPSIEVGGFNGNSFSSSGSVSDIARAMAACINNSSINFDAVIEDGASEFYVKSRVKGYRLLQSGVLIPNNNANNFLSVENRDTKDASNPKGLLKMSTSILSSNEVYYMNGGNSAGKSVLVTQDSVADVEVGNFIGTGNAGVFNQIIDIVEDIDRSNTIYKKLILESPNTLEDGEQKVYADNVARIGLFSAYDIHDMNFDFYDISNSELKELEYETNDTINYEPERSSANQLTVFGNDFDLAPYSYFTGISDILPEETLDEYNEVKLFSEYDRLEENNLKEFAVRSRVVPNINKWVLKDSLTVREQPYYLNANEAFGRTNFAPDFSVPGRDRLGMTHEWFYLDNLPKYLSYDQLNNTFSYVNFMDGFELTPSHFKSTSYNYFDRFMVTEGFEVKDSYGLKSFIKTNLQKKYTLVSGGNSASFAKTIFKGIKVDFKNRKEFLSDKATEFVKSSDFNGYKFSTLVCVRGGRSNNDISYEVIQNKKFKFVIFLITLSMDDLWIDGAINRKLLYEMNHSFLWNGESENFSFSDVNLSGALNLNDVNFSNSTAQDYRVVKGIQHVDGSSPQFLEQINPDDDNRFGAISVTITDSSGDVTFLMKILSVDDQDQITLSGNPVDLNGNPVNLSNIPGYIQSSATYVYKQGGKNAFTSILDSLAATSVADLLRVNTGEVVYTTVEEDGTTLNNRFEIEFENGVEIIKQASLVTVADRDKPKTFKLKKGTIGFNLAAGDTYYPFLVRQNGDYTVDTKPVVTFTDTYTHFKTNDLQTTINQTELGFEEPMYKHSLTNATEIKLARDYYKRYNRCKTAFNLGFIQDDGSHDSNWGIIKNHFYRKVNESNAGGVTKLSTSTDKLPLYPLIGEVAIDKKDVNVFKSSWDKNYYTRNLSGGLEEQVPGTFETKEERSYLGSTIMKVKDSYNIINFTTQKVESQEEQDSILENNNNTTDVVLYEDEKYVYIDFYIDSSIRKLLSSDGVLSSISRFVSAADSAGDKTIITDDAELYVENNLQNTFNLDIIKIYTNRVKGVSSEVLSTSNINNLDDGGYSNDINFTFKAHEQKPLNFRLIYNKRLGYSYRIRPMIKIKS